MFLSLNKKHHFFLGKVGLPETHLLGLIVCLFLSVKTTVQIKELLFKLIDFISTVTQIHTKHQQYLFPL